MESADGKKHPFKLEGGRGPLHSPLAMAFAVSALLFALFFIFLPDVGTKEFSDFSPPPFVAYKSYSKDFANAADLADYAPLFVTTRWNHKPTVPNIPKPEGWETSVWKNYFNESEIIDSKFLESVLAGDVRDARLGLMRSVMRSVFSGYRRADIPESDQAKASEVEIIDISTGKKVLSRKLPEPLMEGIFSTAQFSVDVEGDGWVGRPVLRKTSGNDAVDEKLSKLLTSKDLLKGLKSGQYRATFIP